MTVNAPLPDPGQPIVLRGGTVLTMNDAHDLHEDADVLVVGERIEAVGPGLEVPEGTFEIDAADGIVMPGMIDTHRHMWQTAMRGYGADWTLSQYFVFFYLEHGRIFRAEDVHAGNLLSGIEALDAGVTTTVDWSHGLQTIDHADAAVDALEAVPGRFVLAYGNLQQGPWEWSTAPDFKRFVERRFGARSDMLGFQLAFDVTGDPAFPEQAAFEVARELGVPVTTHAGVWGATNDDGIRLTHEHGFMTPENIYVHAATLTDDSYQRIAATGGSVSVSTESEQSAGQGYPPTWQLRRHDIPVSLSMDTSVWWSGDLFSAMRGTLGADRAREHLEAHARHPYHGRVMPKGDIKKVVLAYSGGLDTSIILKWLQTTYGCEVVTFTADLGQGEELAPAREKALLLGIKPQNIFIEDLREEFVRDYVFPMFRANALYEGIYLLGTSIARPLIAKKQIEIAHKVGADAVCHGATGKGNDQVRFELTYYALDPSIKIIAPWREWSFKGREDLLAFAREHQIPIAKDKEGEAPFSVDANLLHSSSEGKVLEDPAKEAPPVVYQRTISPMEAPDKATEVRIGFEKGDAGQHRRQDAVARRAADASSTSSARPTASAGSIWSRTASSA